MSKEPIIFIINPKSGRSHRSDLESQICRHLDQNIYTPQFFVTEYAGHAKVIAQKAVAEGIQKVVAVGGDGTVNEVASALVNTETALGIIPTGSGNGLARHLKVTGKLEKIIGILNAGTTVQIDAGTLNEQWFFCTCGIGFDAKVGHKFAKTKNRGFVSYIKTVIREYRAYKPKKYKISIDKIVYKRRAFLITVANAAQYGNNAFIAPKACIDDGEFDVCLLKPFPLVNVFQIIVRLFNRKMDKSRHMEIIRGKKIKIKKPNKKYVFHYDGEPVRIKNRKVVITMHPKVLKVIS